MGIEAFQSRPHWPEATSRLEMARGYREESSREGISQEGVGGIQGFVRNNVAYP